MEWKALRLKLGVVSVNLINKSLCKVLFSLLASGPWNPASFPCALFSLSTHRVFKTPGWWSTTAAQRLTTYAITTPKNVCRHSSTSAPSFRSWRDTRRWEYVKAIRSAFIFSIFSLSSSSARSLTGYIDPSTACFHTSHSLSVPPVARCDVPKWFVC